MADTNTPKKDLRARVQECGKIALGAGLLLVVLNRLSDTVVQIGWPAYVAIAVFALVMLWKAFFSSKEKMSNAAQAMGSTMMRALWPPIYRFSGVAASFALVFFFIRFFAEKNGTHFSFTVTMIITSLIVGAVLTLVIRVMEGKGAKTDSQKDQKESKSDDGIGGFIRATKGFAYAMALLAVLTSGYHYYQPRYFDPYSTDIIAEYKIDPVTYELFDKDKMRNDKTGQLLRDMIPEDVPKIDEKRKKELGIISGTAQKLGYELQNMPKQQTRNTVDSRPKKSDYAYLEILSPESGTQVSPGDVVTITWRAAIVDSQSPWHFQIAFWDQGGWREEIVLASSTDQSLIPNHFVWRVPEDIQGNTAVIHLGFKAGADWVRTDRIPVFVN
ncbi:MAG: hypothetical protein COU47_02555 [Candidatus Niyogibacteria bacterium CG10_big_fil_rev_8_21_14_0_10_46_36]|uniref:Uncharacterized protein n=1 Tax=Candidatus Niyogibacteria bacterium CG10_big_fil_rev_8_21_14_0_10_46_36 TaxID=1974726 RepID=A0A2H0TF85_9BACT|nr:MAG: hypothetical protein COU47_02555 [Candidatus Niyogibacteria bacterium CG10_big_fil_rev_8_21_14_0_10_46_36]